MNNILRILLISIFLIVSTDVDGHSDTSIALSDNWKLEGLSKKYTPTRFDVQKWTLTLGKSKFTFPKCISERENIPRIDDFQLKNSWYHPTYIENGKEIPHMPNYLSFFVRSKNFFVLIDLDTAKPFHLSGTKFVALTDEEICNRI